MRAVYHVIAFVAFCWAVFGVLSLLSELRFMVDGWNWSLGHVSISMKEKLLTIAKGISEAVSRYRELMHAVASLLHIPPLPPVAYDALGVDAFAAVRITSVAIAEQPFDTPLAPQQGHVVLGVIGKLIALALVLAALFGIDHVYRHFT